MADLHLTLAINDYDHTRDLFTGRVRPVGIDLTCLRMEVEETFLRFLSHQEWDVSEISFAMAAAAIDRGEAPFVLIPVFPSRMFRLSAIYIRAGGPVKTVADLAGRKVGQPQWAQTATAYIRGWLAETMGVPLNEIDWYQLGPGTPGRVDARREEPPAGIRLTDLPGGSLAEMLVAGELDAILSAKPPGLFLEGDPRIARLFPDYRAAEQDYFAATGIYPIMHTVAIRRSSYEANRWIARNLFNAFEEAKNLSAWRMTDFNVSQIALPWLQPIAEQVTHQFFPDGDYWPYGVARNRTTIEAFLRFCHDQGLTTRRLVPEELFVPEALEPFRILRI